MRLRMLFMSGFASFAFLIACGSGEGGNGDGDGDNGGEGGTDNMGDGDGDGDNGGDGDAPACPDVTGGYEIVDAEGACETLNLDAAQSIEEGEAACVVDFVSEEPADGAKGINGSASIDGDGNFTEARLFLDDVLRFPCAGTWDEDAETMTVLCEGGSGDCTATLERQ